MTASKKGKKIPWWSAETENQNINPVSKARIRSFEKKQIPVVTKGELKKKKASK